MKAEQALDKLVDTVLAYRPSKRSNTMQFRPGKNTHRCIYCGGSGARTIVAGGWVHKRCLPRSAK